MASKDESATFSVELEDETSGAANDAANALSKLRGAIDGDLKALRSMQQAMRNLQGGTQVNVAQFRELKAKIDEKKQAISAAQSSYIALGGSFARSARGASGTGRSFADLIKQARALPGPVGLLSGRFAGLGSILASGVIVAGIGAIVAAMAALVTATLAANTALFAYGVAQADARRSELLRLEGLTKLRNWWGIAAGNAGELQRAIDRVSGSVAIGRDKVAGYAEQLYRMHLRGENLSAALEGVAIKAAVQGDAQAKMFAGWAAGAAMTGRSVRALADDVKARLGGIAAAQMLSLTVQSEKLRESWSMLFSGLKLDPFLKGLGLITGLFTQNAATGRALKALLETMFQPTLDALPLLALGAKRFFQGMTIGLLEIGIGLQRTRLWLVRTFGDLSIFKAIKGVDATMLVVKAGELTVKGFVAALAVAGAGLAAIAAVVGAIGSVFAVVVGGAYELIAGPIRLFGTLTSGLLAAGKAAINAWRSIDWTALGKAVADGVIGGIRSAAGAVMNAVGGLGKSALATFKRVLGIASPAKAFVLAGGEISRGVRFGVDADRPLVQRAVSRLVSVRAFQAQARTQITPARALQAQQAAIALPASSPSIPDTQSAPPQRAARALSSMQTDQSIKIEQLHVHVSGDNPREQAEDFRTQLIRALQGVATELGAPFEPEPAT